MHCKKGEPALAWQRSYQSEVRDSRCYKASVARESSPASFGKAKHTVLSRAFLMADRAEDMLSVHTCFSEPFFPPLRTTVRGSRMLAAAGTNCSKS